jgi:O-antigen/teichoic acid export membrane protein
MTDLGSASPGDRATAAARSNIVMYPLIAVVGWAATIAVARVLPLDDFALYAVALALRGTIQFLADLGTGAASARMFAELEHMGARRQAWRLYYRLASGRGAVVLLLIVAIALAPDAFADLLGLHGDETDFLAFVAAISAAEVMALLGYYVLSGTLALAAANRITLTQSVLQPALVLGAAWLGLGLRGILWALVLGSVIRALGWNVAAVRALRSVRESDAELEGLGQKYSQVATSSIAGKAAGWIHSRQLASIVALSTSTRPDLATFAVGYDFVHQSAQFASTPTTGIVLPSFSVVERTTTSLRHRFDQATRLMALLLFPIMTVLVAVAPSLMPVAFGSQYDEAVPYVLIIAPALALELVLLIPATGLMLTQTELLRPYLVVKLVAVPLGLFYFVLPGVSLLLVAAFMMSVRVGSAVALHLAIFRRTRIHTSGAWLGRSIGVALVSGVVGAAVAMVVPVDMADLVLAPVACLSTFALLLRVTRILLPEDASLMLRVLPAARRGVEFLAAPSHVRP